MRQQEGIVRLNRAHPRQSGDRFLLLHRRSVWSDTQESWIGWERKRGKLHELNRLLRGATDTTFVSVGGAPPQVPPEVRYVVTLDSDTRLPRDTIYRLIGKMAHVLNRPRIDPLRRLVVEGYGILQPRVTLALPFRSEGSWFQRVFSGATGMDPYAAPVSDVYQDLFGEGSFLGKGIYDVDAFHGDDGRKDSGECHFESRPLRRHLRSRWTWRATSKLLRSFHAAMTSRLRASIVGRGEIGSCCAGCSSGRRQRRAT